MLFKRISRRLGGAMSPRVGRLLFAFLAAMPVLGLLSLALVGCACGWLSLYLVPRRVQACAGAVKTWLFCGGVCLLSGAAIFIGRFLRSKAGSFCTAPLPLWNSCWPGRCGTP